MAKLLMLFLSLVAMPAAAFGQRVIECQFVSVAPPSFAYGKWSFAAEMSGGRLVLLLVRPGDAAEERPAFVRSFAPVATGESVFHDIGKGSGDGAGRATLVLARLGPDDMVTLDEWVFGDSEDYDRLVLKCPSHL